MSSDWTFLADVLKGTSDQTSLEEILVANEGNLNTQTTREERDEAQGSALRTVGGLQVFERADGAVLAYTYGRGYSWRIGAVFTPDGKGDRAIYAKAAGIWGPFLGGSQVLEEIKGLVNTVGNRKDVSSINPNMSWFV